MKILVAGLIGGIFAFFAGWLIYGILLKGWMPSGMAAVQRPETEMVWWAMIASNLLWGIFIAYVFVQWANISTLQGGAVAGAILGFLISAAFDTGLYSMTTLYATADIVKDVAMTTVFTALLGAVVGWWLGRGYVK